MKEPVRKTNHPWLVGTIVLGIGALYFFLLADSKFQEPSAARVYDPTDYIKLDNIETRFTETGTIFPDLEDPSTLTVGPQGKLYIAGKNRVVVYGENDTEVARFSVNGTPNAIEVAPDGLIFLAIVGHVETVNDRGEVQAVWADLGPRSHLTSIAANDESVFVGDAGNRVVYHFNREGELLDRIGERDLDRDVEGIQAPSPYLDVAFDMHGTLWVANSGLLGLESYRSNGDIISYWYKPTLELEGFSGCCNPVHIAFNSEGKLITGEKGIVRIKVYEVSQGIFEELVAGSEQFPHSRVLKDLAVDANDRILALDSKYNSVRIFELKDDSNGRQTD